MRVSQLWCAMFFCITFACAVATSRAQEKGAVRNGSDDPQNAESKENTDQLIDRLIAREQEQNALLSRYHPIIETYGQDAKIVRGAQTVVRDWYFLGEADSTKDLLSVKSLLSPKDEPPLKALLWGSYPPGFLQETYVDRNGFDRQHYKFRLVGREFLGSVRCLVFDMTPLPKTGKGRFEGRVWAEDENLTIIRFSGAYYPINGWERDHWVLWSHWHSIPFDSWRVNVQPGLWLPAYVFNQERWSKNWIFRAQTRLWGYSRENTHLESESATLAIESPSAMLNVMNGDNADRSPLQAQRQWRTEAEENALETLQEAGLIAPPGPVDKILDTVLHNLEVSNNLVLEPEIKCRILTTGNLEIYFIGRTLILSRGLIDVLPDEATLAAVVAQGIGRIVTTDAIPDKFGFGDTMQISMKYIVRGFRVRENQQQLNKANAYAFTLLKNSPYKNSLGSATNFLQELQANSKKLIQLTHPIWGDGVSRTIDSSTRTPSEYQRSSQEGVPLALGGRLKLDPWDGRVSLLDAAALQSFAAYEKVPFGMTPFMPFLTRYQQPKESANSQDSGGH